MLVLSRKKGESIMIGDDIELVILDVGGDSIRVGIVAPKEVEIFRKEIYLTIQSSNEEASLNTLDTTKLQALFKNKR
ncbi:carbon storage regulator CsrA [Paenibacillus eucommiae]|uniref:Translational regulator CsrA n=1 Tax=Paenibacillus eucommiae TaxID=1355755 RepID=A0ABS4IYI1_9BACL|nr:carbon storage regulator CsrA [Paenibacillus eucommiae]MBP1992644.1 carbon storage regulator [Paenibacillus eucommiae]